MTDEAHVGVGLKGCPFCGEPASVLTYQTESLWSHNIVTYTKVGCDDCDIAFRSEPGFEVEAPEKWNTRRPLVAEGEVVERVARAIAKLRYSHCGADASDALVQGKPNWTFCIPDARAALAALREEGAK